MYSYDLAGNRRSDAAYVKGGGANGADTGGTYVYTYDDLHRLVQSQRGTDELFQYYYDGAGRTVASRSVLYGRTGGYDEYRYNQYDATGHLQNSKVVNRDPNSREVKNYTDVAYHNTGIRRPCRRLKLWAMARGVCRCTASCSTSANTHGGFLREGRAP